MSEQVDRTVLPIRRPPFAGVIDGSGAKKLKSALAEAQSGMSG